MATMATVCGPVVDAETRFPELLQIGQERRRRPSFASSLPSIYAVQQSQPPRNQPKSDMGNTFVNHNQTHRQEIGGGYLWSPKRSANGVRNPFMNQYGSSRPVEFGQGGIN
jgi:hypothetical protein